MSGGGRRPNEFEVAGVSAHTTMGLVLVLTQEQVDTRWRRSCLGRRAGPCSPWRSKDTDFYSVNMLSHNMGGTSEVYVMAEGALKPI